MSNSAQSSPEKTITAVVSFVAGIYFCGALAGVLAMFAAFGFDLLPNAALRVASGILVTHAVLVGWSKYKNRPVSWLPLLGSIGAFAVFVIAFGAVAQLNEGASNAGMNDLTAALYESAKNIIAYATPLVLPLRGVTKTLVELDQK